MSEPLIELLILDVDGVLTDGRIHMAGDGLAGQSFHVQDGCSLKLWQRCGGKTAIISKRGSEAVAQRAAELGIAWVYTGVSQKEPTYETVLKSAHCSDASVSYMGDDLPDLKLMARCGFPVAVGNAVPTVKRAAKYITRRPGGCGAVAEVVELILRRQGLWSSRVLEV